MNLAEFLTTNPEPGAEQTSGLAIVFSAELSETLAAVQSEHGDPRYQVRAIALTDGRQALSADVLTETSEGGLFHSGFSHLNPESFLMVEIVPFSDLEPLIPVSEE